MLMQQLFSTGIMKMGPSRVDPARQVGVFDPNFVAGLPALRTAELEKFRWLVGEWSYENAVPATSLSPAYSDIGTTRFALSKDGAWICIVAPDGTEIQNITFDPFSKQWIYVLLRGSYGILRSSDGWSEGRTAGSSEGKPGNQIAFSGLMTMIGINCEWRMTWTRERDDHFHFVNEERNGDGSWAYIDEWRFKRKTE
jgi:hypothetical protein